MPDSRNYVQGRYIDYYTSNKFDFAPLFEPTDDIEWGYTTKDGSIYRHLNSTEVETSMADMREHDGFGVYHSLTEYTNPSESGYSDKDPVRTRVAIRIQTNSPVPPVDEWDELISSAEETKSILQSEFPFDFDSIRTSVNTVYLVSNEIPCETPTNLNDRIESYVRPDQSGSFEISSIQPMGNGSSRSSRPPSELSRNVKKYVQDKYLEIREAALDTLNGQDILGYSSVDDEEFPDEEIDEEFSDLLDDLQEIDGIASTKSFQFVQSLVNKTEDEITSTYLTETTFNCKSVSQYYAEQYLSESWLGNREVVNISAIDLYGLIPCEGSLSTHGGFYVYQEDLENMDYVPSDYLAEFYSGNSIKLSLSEDVLDIVAELEVEVESESDIQTVSEDVGMFLLSSGFAEKESEI